MKGMLRILLLLLIVAAGASIGLCWYGLKSLDEPVRLTQAIRYRIAAGTRFSRVAAELGARGIVRLPKFWSAYARWNGLAARIKAGQYALAPGATPRRLLQDFVDGNVVMHEFTIVDGWTVKDLLAALRRDPDIHITLPISPTQLMRKFGESDLDPEGQFLPETYKLPAGSNDVEVLSLAHAALVRELHDAWKDRDPGLPLRDETQLLTLASIVEKETALAAERAKIAGVYLHRLSIGMRLQADPTIIYGMGDLYDGDIRSVDLRTDGPYNTYTRAGLPPTPIALAGVAALRATANPQSTDALFFVASSAGDGSHVFTSNLRDHNAAVARYVEHQRHPGPRSEARP
jgi:UPF0755 protein